MSVRSGRLRCCMAYVIDDMKSEDEMGAAALQLRNVTKLFGQFKAVNEVSFSLGSGSICGFLGPNGAGKTTTIRMILEILRPTSGAITVLGRPSALAVRHRLGYLPEEKGLYKKMKTWAIIAYFATLKGMTRKAAKRRAFELLERYGLKDFAEKPTDALSKGMGQKVQILASIAHDPELVILDEPFAGLDPVNQGVMEDLIRELARRNRTVLFSTHVMEHAERLCERILLIARGRLIFDGSMAEAKRTVPRRVRLETEDDIAPLRDLAEVARCVRCPGPTARPMARSTVPCSGNWSCARIRTRKSFCRPASAEGIRLKSFNQSEPTLHDVFMRLVGPEAKEVAFR